MTGEKKLKKKTSSYIIYLHISAATMLSK